MSRRNPRKSMCKKEERIVPMLAPHPKYQCIINKKKHNTHTHTNTNTHTHTHTQTHAHTHTPSPSLHLSQTHTCIHARPHRARHTPIKKINYKVSVFLRQIDIRIGSPSPPVDKKVASLRLRYFITRLRYSATRLRYTFTTRWLHHASRR